MKKTILILVMLSFGTMAWAQEGQDYEMKTIFGNKGIRSNGGYGAVTTAYSKIDDRDAIMIGGRGAWLINHSIGIGLSGTGFLTDYKVDTELNQEYQLVGGYGGLLLEFIVNPKSAVHLSFPVTIGAGGMTYIERNGIFDNPGVNPFIEDSQAFFVVEPGVEVDLNVLKFMRVAFGASYRFTSDIDLTYANTGNSIVGSDALQGFSAGITLKFGKF